MAKGQVSEKDLEEGLSSLGGLGGIQRIKKRDSPFGPEFVKEPSMQAKTVTFPTPTPTPTKESEDKTEEKETREEIINHALRETEEKVPTPKKRGRPKKGNEKGRVGEIKEEETQSVSKESDITERITLQMTGDMREEIDSLARRLMRQRSEKRERITNNTVMRVAIRTFLDSFKLTDTDSPSSEEELLTLAKRKR